MKTIPLSKLALLRRVNSQVNQLPAWAEPVFADDWAPHDGVPNDCDSFATRKQSELAKAGIAAKDMRLVLCYAPERHDLPDLASRCHLILVVRLDGEDWALDNLLPLPVPVTELPERGYILIAGQVEGGSAEWQTINGVSQ